MTYTREQLIEAQQLYNIDFVNNPQNYECLTQISINDDSSATASIDHLLNFVDNIIPNKEYNKTMTSFLEIENLFQRLWNLKQVRDKLDVFLRTTSQSSENWNHVFIPGEMELYLDNRSFSSMCKDSLNSIDKKINELESEIAQYKIAKVDI